MDGSHEPNWEIRQYDVSKVQRTDFVIVPFNSQRHLAHTMVSFGFESGEYLSVSVEARLRGRQQYSILKGLIGRYPLTYIFADERDTIGVRTEARRNTVHLYPSSATPEQSREFLVSILRRANQLKDNPERYNTVTNNCLTNLRNHVNDVWPGRVGWNWRILFTGHAGFLAYEIGLLDSAQSFESLNGTARINELAKDNWHCADFSRRIRAKVRIRTKVQGAGE